jgi:hypothetical protein
MDTVTNKTPAEKAMQKSGLQMRYRTMEVITRVAERAAGVVAPNKIGWRDRDKWLFELFQRMEAEQLGSGAGNADGSGSVAGGGGAIHPS